MIKQVVSEALLVRSVPFGESDLITTFFTKDVGVLGATVRGGRRSQKRFGGTLEPIHTLEITLDDRGKELCFLKEAKIAQPRLGITGSLDAMDAAGHALRWIRHLCPPRTPEPRTWASLTELFNRLDYPNMPVDVSGPGQPEDPRPHLAVFGLHLLTDMGYALELERCVRCGKACPEGRSAYFDGARGGLVCLGCGGARRTVKAPLRALALAAQRGEDIVLSRENAIELIAIVEEAMAAHAGFEPL